MLSNKAIIQHFIIFKNFFPTRSDARCAVHSPTSKTYHIKFTNLIINNDFASFPQSPTEEDADENVKELVDTVIKKMVISE